ncbi:MAG: rRNA maturation RNase YbeY [Candidatus Omnitrophica bacterium]|nr:rRNA maturation RNase YbeY [Candidatus Omnitrophota bacterium]
MGLKKEIIKVNVTNLNPVSYKISSGVNKKRRINTATIKKIARIVLKKLSGKKRKLNLNIIFVTDKYIKKLNKTYRHKNLSTDVLCFCMPEGTDIFISSDRAVYNSKRFGTTFLNELYLYVIHGILHMLGFRDDTAGERQKMERTQERILSQLSS